VSDIAAPTLAEAAVAYARELAKLGVRETARNSGPWIDQVLAQVHAKPGDPWCAATLFEIFQRAATACGVPNPCRKSAGALRIYALAEERYKVPASAVVSNPALLKGGMAFFEDHSGDPRDGVGAGHCGVIVEDWDGTSAMVKCISGNTNMAGSREGNAIVLQDRAFSKMYGFLDFSRG
jgi:hypothetical protein